MTQKNFTLPEKLAKKWNKLQQKGAKESSVNASGALFLYMIMPQSIRQVSKEIASEFNNMETAKKQFWDRLSEISRDSLLAKALLDAVEAREEEPRKTKIESAAKSRQSD